jgi:hypothetical protein
LPLADHPILPIIFLIPFISACNFQVLKTSFPTVLSDKNHQESLISGQWNLLGPTKVKGFCSEHRKTRVRNLQKSLFMAFDLKPLTNEIIHKMNYEPHTLWIVKLDEEVFGPFEIESLKHYAAENEHQFETALASRMDTNDWQPFFSYAHFLSIADHLQTERQGLEKYWILNQGQKAGPLSRLDIDKKFELGILSMTDLVSVDDGHTWLKFFSHAVFNPNNNEVQTLPVAPLESTFQRAAEDFNEIMDHEEKTDTHKGLAALTHMSHNRGKLSFNLEEMDLKSLDETEISRTLKWAIPTAVAGIFIILGAFILSPSNETASNDEEKTNLPSTGQSSRKEMNAQERSPASYRPLNQQSAGLNNTPAIHENEYPSHVETHFNEPDSNNEIEKNPPHEPQENSLESNTGAENETLDQVMGADAPEIAPEQPVVEESGDF